MKYSLGDNRSVGNVFLAAADEFHSINVVFGYNTNLLRKSLSSRYKDGRSFHMFTILSRIESSRKIRK